MPFGQPVLDTVTTQPNERERFETLFYKDCISDSVKGETERGAERRWGGKEGDKRCVCVCVCVCVGGGGGSTPDHPLAADIPDHPLNRIPVSPSWRALDTQHTVRLTHVTDDSSIHPHPHMHLPTPSPPSTHPTPPSHTQSRHRVSLHQSLSTHPE